MRRGYPAPMQQCIGATRLRQAPVCARIAAGPDTVVLPFFNDALAKHPAWRRSIDTLREVGVTVLVSPDTYEPHRAGAGDEALKTYPWHLALEAMEESLRAF